MESLIYLEKYFWPDVQTDECSVFRLCHDGVQIDIRFGHHRQLHLLPWNGPPQSVAVATFGELGEAEPENHFNLIITDSYGRLTTEIRTQNMSFRISQNLSMSSLYSRYCFIWQLSAIILQVIRYHYVTISSSKSSDNFVPYTEQRTNTTLQ